VFNLSIWKYSFELVSRELDLARKKKQTLDDLFISERISRPTYEYLGRELTEAIIDLEANQKSLAEKMTVRIEELESQINSLELFLANLEIHYVADEVDKESYRDQSKAIAIGLEATKQELDTIKSSLIKILPEAPEAQEVTPQPAIEAPKIEETSEPAETEELVQDVITESAITENVTTESNEKELPASVLPVETSSESTSTYTADPS